MHLHIYMRRWLINRQSGLLALSGSKDMRDIIAAEAHGDDRARLAIEVFVHRIVLTVGAYFTLLEGYGALVFGGGIGTHSTGNTRARRGELARLGRGS